MIHENFYDRSMDLPSELLVGAIDSHVHAGPVLRSNPGHQDPFEVAVEARDAGMRSIVYYDVFGWASGTAWMVNRHVPGIRTFGGYLMNSCHGGLNPRSVRTALYMEQGCCFISFGSHCTEFSASRESTIIDGELVPLKDAFPKFAAEEIPRSVRIPVDGPISDDLAEILEMIAAHPDVYLNTGHVSGPEVLRLLDLAEEFGIQKVLIAHPARQQLSVEQQKDAARRGVFLEGCLVDWLYPHAPRTHYYVEKEYMDRSGDMPRKRPTASQWMADIREVGPEHFVLATDYGIRAASTPVQGMRTLITTLLDYEFTPEEIRTMTAHNPARLLGLEPE
ncbi:DUF6282 family protein [Qingshengfaniella alkalisoli]|uniref:Amidohydrolase-related domain-containing protein n=1 Tax=Qingshengfaniella alkalisoli TaxID=2599296 RepID=A0A5B8I9G5_9RHOB|nr:DUF6282 family protein [Qingshengfaniella alkalisoli]QDY70529.1 hypothetical protein FPZ52_12550 [Qingshengfaniella alkalisoli]